MEFQVPGWGLCTEVAGHPAGPIAGPSQGIGKVADDQLVWEKLWEQEAFLANILYEGRNNQQGRVLQLFYGHETFAVHTSTWVGPRRHVWGQLPASEWCPWDSNGGSLRVGYGTRTSDPVLAHPDHRLCVWLCTLYMDTDSYNMSLDGEGLHDFLLPERLLWALSWVVPQRGLRCTQGRVCGHDYTPGALRLVPSAAMLRAVSCMMKRHQTCSRQRVVQWWHGGSL